MVWSCLDVASEARSVSQHFGHFWGKENQCH